MSTQIRDILDSIRVKTEKVGLYLNGASISVSGDGMEEPYESIEDLEADQALRKKLVDEEMGVMFFTDFTFGEVAFTERIQDPSAVVEKEEFIQIMPSEIDLLEERIRRNVEAGRAPLDDGDE